MPRPSSEPSSVLAVRVPRDLQYRMRVRCAERDGTIAAFVVAAIRDSLDRANATTGARLVKKSARQRSVGILAR